MTDLSLSQGLSALAALFAVHLLVVASPGPAFLAVSRTAISTSRTAGVTAAAAMATGAMIWAVATMFGLDVLLAKAPWLYDAMRLGGAAYLIYLGVGMLRSAWRGDKPAAAALLVPAGRRTFLRSLGVQLSNPKAAVFFGSIFVTLLPVAAPLWVKAGALAILGVNEFGFYGLVVVVLLETGVTRILGNGESGVDGLCTGLCALARTSR